MLKNQVRIIGWDDCAFTFSQKRVRIVGVVFRGGDFLDGLLTVSIKKDGMDVTCKMIGAIRKSRHFDQLSYIMTNGISFGGLNILDIQSLHKMTELLVIAVIRKEPDMEKFLEALEKFEDGPKRKEIVSKAGEILRFKDIFYQKVGLSRQQSEDILKITCLRSKIPEPLRVAHLIASGLGGESRGRA